MGLEFVPIRHRFRIIIITYATITSTWGWRDFWVPAHWSRTHRQVTELCANMCLIGMAVCCYVTGHLRDGIAEQSSYMSLQLQQFFSNNYRDYIMSTSYKAKVSSNQSAQNFCLGHNVCICWYTPCYISRVKINCQRHICHILSGLFYITSEDQLSTSMLMEISHLVIFNIFVGAAKISKG